jgi:hypothetical protein
MNSTSNELRERFRQMFHEKWAEENLPQYDELLEKFVFHMMDAADEIHGVADILQGSDAVDAEDFRKRLHRFFLHAVPHLVSAGQLYDYVPNIFPEQHGVHEDPRHDDEAANPPVAQGHLTR